MREVLTRNGYYLPRSKVCCSVEYMWKVLNGEVFCLRYEDVRIRPCPSSPSLEYLLEEVQEAVLRKEGSTLGNFKKHRPDKEFLLTVLSSLSPEHQIFTKSYTAPPRSSKTGPPSKLKNFDSLFSGLPPPT